MATALDSENFNHVIEPVSIYGLADGRGGSEVDLKKSHK